MATIAAAANSGLNLNMSAAQLRARLAAQKKYDPKREAMDLRRKHEIIQTMWIINPLHTHTQQSTIRKVEEWSNQWRVKRWREIISIWIIRWLQRVNTIGTNLTLIIFHLICLVTFFFLFLVFVYFLFHYFPKWWLSLRVVVMIVSFL